jgi:hypothetical protein
VWHPGWFWRVGGDRDREQVENRRGEAMEGVLGAIVYILN